MAMAGAGILWLGWNGLQRAATLTSQRRRRRGHRQHQLATCVSLLVWIILDSMVHGKPSVVGAITA